MAMNDAARRWLARLSWSFCIVAVWLLFEAHLLNLHGGPAWQIILLVVGAAASLGLGAAGVRARHRDWDDERG
jgi:hypothetical protein